MYKIFTGFIYIYNLLKWKKFWYFVRILVFCYLFFQCLLKNTWKEWEDEPSTIYFAFAFRISDGSLQEKKVFQNIDIISIFIFYINIFNI